MLFESGDIPFHHDQPLDESCYAEIETCHILILIIGGRYGSAASTEAKTVGDDKIYSHYNSITKREYEKAREKGMPIFIFVDKGVLAEYETFKKNRKNASIVYAHVDNTNIFYLLDDIIAQRVNNFVRAFENFDDITSWLKEQWAGLFADFLGKRSTDLKIKNLQDQIEELKDISSTLKVYNEAMVRSSNVKGASQIINQEELKLRRGKVIRFVQEPLIGYFLQEKKMPSEKIFDAFISTKNLAEFCKALNLNEFYNELNSRAHEEYDMLRSIYLGDNIKPKAKKPSTKKETETKSKEITE